MTKLVENLEQVQSLSCQQKEELTEMKSEKDSLKEQLEKETEKSTSLITTMNEQVSQL